MTDVSHDGGLYGGSAFNAYYPANRLDIDWIISAFDKMDSPQKLLVRIPDSNTGDNHVLAGDILNPQNNTTVIEDVVRFINSDGEPNGYCFGGLPEFSSGR